MSFRDVRDQEVPIRLLQNMLRRNRIPNGLLFWGPSGVGKRLTAMAMARAVNCAEGDADACGVCLSCRKVTSGNHPDVKVVVPVRRARVINVETVEGINEFAALRAFESAWRVFVILDAERMNPAAQNHFLKTLEEPPGNSLFILVTEFPRVLLPTIRSRCQQVRFGALRPETVADILRRERDLPPDLAQSIAGLSQGQVSRALDLVDSEKRAVALEVSRRLADGDDPLALAEEFAKHLAAQREQIAAKAGLDESGLVDASREDIESIKAEEKARVDAEYRRDIMEYLYLLETWYRDVAVYSVMGDASHVLNRDQIARLEAAAPGAAPLEQTVAAIEKARIYLERFIKEERVFRDLFFTLARSGV